MARNLIFETIRGVFRPITYGLLYEGQVDWRFVSEMLVTVVIFVAMVTLFVPKSFLKKHNVSWAWANIEFFFMFTDSFVYAMNKVETVHNGRTMYFLFGFFLEANLGMFMYIVEDLIFGDLKVIGGLDKIWAAYQY